MSDFLQTNTIMISILSLTWWIYSNDPTVSFNFPETSFRTSLRYVTSLYWLSWGQLMLHQNLTPQTGSCHWCQRLLKVMNVISLKCHQQLQLLYLFFVHKKLADMNSEVFCYSKSWTTYKFVRIDQTNQCNHRVSNYYGCLDLCQNIESNR